MARAALSTPTEEVERLRGALDSIASMIEDATKPSNGPHRFKLPSGEIIVGEVADAIYRILHGIKDIARSALTSGAR